jgi:hypothetical protein
MATNSTTPKRGARRRIMVSVLPAALAAAAGVIHLVLPTPTIGTDGTVSRLKPSTRPTVEAAFLDESYAPGQVARLLVTDRISGATLQVFRAGTEAKSIAPRDVMLGTPVTRPRIGGVRMQRVFTIRIGEWESGFYYARLRARGDRIGYAPFVLSPRRLGEHRVAVVLPTFTWQAYNFRDDDGDGDADTWYAGRDEKVARLGRPYEDRGVPPHYKHYDQPFLRWLFHTGRRADYLAQSDLHALRSGDALARAYSLIIFPGHHEYVTASEYDAVERYRDLGGNLVFLSANNYFWRVDKRRSGIWRIKKWRDLGRPEASLIGVQYIGNDEGQARGAWLVRAAGASSWIFDGTGLGSGSGLSNGGIEIDKTAPSTPRGTRILAEIPDLLGPGMTGQMTYYETSRGAKVFAAGAFTLAGAVWQPKVQRLMENLWARLAHDEVPRG